MSNITNQQLADLLLGIARAQLAIADAVESSKPGFKFNHLRPMVESAARLRMDRPAALVDFPPRLLLQMLGRSAPTTDQVLRELEVLLGGAKVGAATEGGSLDLTK